MTDTTNTPFVVKWNSVDVEPEDKQFCHIRGESAWVLTHIMYSRDLRAWVDLFATPEAGASYGKESGICAWVDASAVDFNAGMPEDEKHTELPHVTT